MQPPGTPPTGPTPPVHQPPLSAPATEAPKRGAKKTTNPLFIMLALMVGAGFGGTCATCATLGSAGGGGTQLFPTGGEKVGVVELLGPIMDAKEVVQNIRKFAKRDDLVAIVVRIDSPGGAVAPSQEIYDAMRWASGQKPVVASMGSVAASGGFWASLGADWVFASPGTITGSIGVITQSPDLQGIAEFLRFKMRTFKSGPLKDAGNPFRDLTPEDEGLFMSLINDIYEQFVTLTAERRKLDIERVKVLADGRVMTGRAALEAGLVDELGGLYDSARKAAHLASLRELQKEAEADEDLETKTSTAVPEDMEDPRLVYPRRPKPTFLELLAEMSTDAVAAGVSSGIDKVSESHQRPPVELR